MDPKKQVAFQFVDDHRAEMLALWREVVTMESGPHEKPGIDAVGARFRQVLEETGATCRAVEFAEAGNMLIGEFGAKGSRPGVIFLGHIDTAIAAGAIAERPFTIRDGKAYGPGVLDMKGGIVAFLYAIKALKAAGYDARPFKVLLAGDEEVLHANSTAPDALVAEAAGHVAAFNCETGFVDDGIVVGRKGIARIMMEVHGVAAHAGNDPENGRNAIIELAHKAIAVQGLTDWDKGISYNVGVIQGGKTSTAVPDYAKIYIDVRYKDPDDLPGVIARVEEVAAKTYIEGTSTKVVMLDGLKPMKTTEGVMKLFALVAEASEENGFGKPYAKYVGGGSDSAYTVLAGVPTVCAMGVKGGRNHSPEEFAIVDTLFERAKLLVAAVLKLDADQGGR
jgi:glutamate carboxypeptidase